MFVVNIHLLLNLIYKSTKLKKITYILLLPLYTAASAVSIFIDPPFPSGLICVLGVYGLLFLIILSSHWNRRIMAGYVTLLYLLADSVISTLFTLLAQSLPLELDDMDVDHMNKAVSLSLNIGFLVLLLYLRGKHKNTIRYSVKLLPAKTYVLLAVSMLLLGCLSTVSLDPSKLPESYSQTIMNALILLSILSSLVVMVFMLMNCISKFYFESTSQLLNKQVKLQLDHYSRIDQLNKEVREFRHDYRNHMVCLHTLLNSGKTEEALEYLCSITDHTVRSLRSFHTGNSVADAILSDKFNTARVSGCDMEFTGAISDRISAFDICTILSNALDNSIEACQRCGDDVEKKIFVNCSVDGNIQLIQVKNPSVGGQVNGKTSKADKENHGFGLYNIKRTVTAMEGRVTIPTTSPEFVLQLEFMIPEEAPGAEKETQ